MLQATGEVAKISRFDCHKLGLRFGMLGAMEPAPRPTLNPAGAGMLLLAAIVLCVLVGAAIGWVAGFAGLGALGGAIVGIPLGVFTVYRRYRGVFT
jgi:F0F1-type ATP synthase assembly protein I